MAKHTTPGWQESIWRTVAVPWVTVPHVSKERRAFNRYTVGTDVRSK